MVENRDFEPEYWVRNEWRYGGCGCGKCNVKGFTRRQTALSGECESLGVVYIRDDREYFYLVRNTQWCAPTQPRTFQNLLYHCTTALLSPKGAFLL